MKRIFIYYILGYFVFCSLGYFLHPTNPYVGFIYATIIYLIFIAILSFFLGLFGADPTEKSPFERRKEQ